MAIQVLFNFFNVLVMLNLLIAIMSNTYDRVTDKKLSWDMYAIADMLLETETIRKAFGQLIGQTHKHEEQYLHLFYTQ